MSAPADQTPPTPAEPIGAGVEIERKRKQFWTDAAARLDRRIDAVAAPVFSSFTWPVVMALSIAAIALGCAVVALIFIFKKR